MARVLPIHFGVVLGCKGGGGKKNGFWVPNSYFQVQAFQTEIYCRPDIPPCQGLNVYFGVVLGCKGGEGKKTKF